MRSPSPILFIVATATLLFGQPTALPAADLDSDTLARTLRRPDPIGSVGDGNSVLDTQDIHWFQEPGEPNFGVFGTALNSEPDDRIEARRLVIGTAGSGHQFGRSNDFFGISSTIDQIQDRREPLDDELESWSLMGFYTAEITSGIHLQPSIGWSCDTTSETGGFRGLLGLKLEY